MRGFGATTTETSEYQRGFIGGVLTSVGFLVGVKALQWAIANPVVYEFINWATTPQVAPADFVNVLALGLIVAVIVVLNGLLGGVGR